jgi:hypothetical protein
MVRKLKRIVAGLTASSLLLVGSIATTQAASNSNPGQSGKVTICHSTASQKNPFIRVNANKNGNVSGHAGNSHRGGRDIIPPFTYKQNGQNKTFPGQNWNAQGQATYNNNCKPTTPGRGGGLTTSSTDDTEQGASQVATPTGAVAAGEGSPLDLSAGAAVGLAASLGLISYGALRLRNLSH